MVNVQRATQGNTISPLQRRLCQKFALIFCCGVGCCSSSLWIINGIFFLNTGSLENTGWGAAGRLPTTDYLSSLTSGSEIQRCFHCRSLMGLCTLDAPFLVSLDFQFSHIIQHKSYVRIDVMWDDSECKSNKDSLHFKWGVIHQWLRGLINSFFLYFLFLPFQSFTVVLSTVKIHLIDNTGTEAKWTWQMEQKS